MKVTATLTRQRHQLPGRARPARRACSKAVRDELGLTGSKEGCDDSECGACMMLLDGKPVNSCSYLALQAEGREVTTVEGLAGDEELGAVAARVPAAGRRPVRLLHARACSCRPRRCCATTPTPPRRRSGSGLSGNLCRCTGYDGIVRAVKQAATGDVAAIGAPAYHADTVPPHHSG